MNHVHTGVLRSPPACLFPEWKKVFRNFAEPISLVITMRDRLTSDFRAKPPALRFWLNDLILYGRLLSERREEIHQTLAMLDAVAPKTWDVGHRIETALMPIYTDLGRIGIVSSGSAIPTDNQIAESRRRVFETIKKFAERPLLESLREAVTVEKGITLPSESAALEKLEPFDSLGQGDTDKNLKTNGRHKGGGRPTLEEKAKIDVKSRYCLAAYTRIQSMFGQKKPVEILEALKSDKDFVDMLKPHQISVNMNLIDGARKHFGRHPTGQYGQK
jgi:hypothetical protein